MPLSFRDLPDDVADRAGGRRDHHGVSFAGLSDVEQAEIGRETVGSERAEEVGRVGVSIDPQQLIARRSRVVLPAGRSSNHVTDGESIVVGGFDSGDPGAAHDPPSFGCPCVAGAALEAGALPGPDRERKRSTQHLAVAWLGHRRLVQREVPWFEPVVGKRRDQHSTVVGSGIAAGGGVRHRPSIHLGGEPGNRAR